MASNQNGFVGDFVDEESDVDDSEDDEDSSSEEEESTPEDDSKIKNTNVWLLKDKDNELEEDGS